MAEIRLICPGCDAEYRIPEKAIPPEGREVECSDCGRVWHGERPARTAEPMDLSGLQKPVPRTYVKLLRDAALAPDRQDEIIRRLEPVDVLTLDTAHDVMISQPQLLASLLNKLSEKS